MFGLDGNASLPIHLPHAVPIANVACGKRHTLIVCTDGTVYSIGANDCGQLGHGEPPWKGNKKTFTKIDQLKDITAIECGDRASAALSASGTGKESKRNSKNVFMFRNMAFDGFPFFSNLCAVYSSFPPAGITRNTC